MSFYNKRFVSKSYDLMWIFIFYLSYETNSLEFFHIFSANGNFSLKFILSGVIESYKRIWWCVIHRALTIQALDSLICSGCDDRIWNITIWNFVKRWGKHSFGILEGVLENLTPFDFNLSAILGGLDDLYSFWSNFKLILGYECLILVKRSRCDIDSLDFKEGINLILNSHEKFVWTGDSNINSGVFTNVRDLSW